MICCSPPRSCCRAQVRFGLRPAGLGPPWGRRTLLAAGLRARPGSRRLTRIHGLAWRPSAERLLRHLAAHGVPMCLATSSHLRHYTLKTTLHTDLFSLFNHRITGGWAHHGGVPTWGAHARCAASSTARVLDPQCTRIRRRPGSWRLSPPLHSCCMLRQQWIPNQPTNPPRRCTGDQVENGKPAPDIFLLAAGRWDPAPSPSACLVFEDAPTGVAAAKAAGM